MLRFIKFFVCCLCVCPSAMADVLSGNAVVNITSDTAVTAKNIAMAEARRQIIMDTLGQYAARDQLKTVVDAAKNDELTGLISQTTIEGERFSDTTYTANISMTLDSVAAQQWLTQNEVQNWLKTSASNDDVFVVVVKLANPLSDWAELNKILDNKKINTVIDEILGNQVTLFVQKHQRSQFMATLHDNGWKYSLNDSAVNIWK